jgi:hypothetical protein
MKNYHICSLSNCFGWSSVCFGSIETPKLSVSVQKRNNRNKHFVSDSAETSFGSSFGCFESKLVSKDTLLRTFSVQYVPLTNHCATLIYWFHYQVKKRTPSAEDAVAWVAILFSSVLSIFILFVFKAQSKELVRGPPE